MFAYCNNNPIVLSDPAGNIPLGSFSYSSITDGGRLRIKHDVPLYNQGNYSLCWAYCQIMVEDYWEGTVTTNEKATERAKNLAISVNGYTDIWGNENWNRGAFPPNRGAKSYISGPRDLYEMLVSGPIYAYYCSPERNGGAHLVVVTGVDVTAGIVYVNNPWGCSGSQTYSEFLYGFYGYNGSKFMPFNAIYPINPEG